MDATLTEVEVQTIDDVRQARGLLQGAAMEIGEDAWDVPAAISQAMAALAILRKVRGVKA